MLFIPNLLRLRRDFPKVVQQQVQYQAALAVTGAWQGTDRVRLYEELGQESLADRKMLRRALQAHKILDGKAT